MEILVKRLQELELFLNQHGVNRYESLLHGYRLQLENYLADPQNVDFPTDTFESIKSHVFGGMGSLNDLLICKENGHIVDNENQANKNLEEFRVNLRKILNVIINKMNNTE